MHAYEFDEMVKRLESLIGVELDGAFDRELVTVIEYVKANEQTARLNSWLSKLARVKMRHDFEINRVKNGPPTAVM